MQRIDENTYIDDTLVTCAEYQLFIDEMREQGQYYQPGHWASDQFPEGQARKPMLGVQHSDAVAFCEWLIFRKEKDWKFRLPTQAEADNYSMKPLGKEPFGYWVENNKFSWVGTIPNDIRVLNNAYNYTFDRAFALGLDYDQDGSFDKDFNLALSNARNRPINLDYDFTNFLNRILNLGLNHSLELDPSLDNALTLAIILYYDLASRKVALDIYIDLYTLQERIAGRSPAFEGIRLVKERTR